MDEVVVVVEVAKIEEAMPVTIGHMSTTVSLDTLSILAFTF